MAADQNTNALLTFKVGPYLLGVPAIEVDAIINMPAFRSVPLAPPSVAGVFTHRDQIACIISMRRKFGLPELAEQTDGQLIIGHIDAGLTAFWVDQVLDMESDAPNDCRSMSAFNFQKAFDSFALKEDEIYLRTDLEALYALEEIDVSQDTPVTPAEDSTDLSARSTSALEAGAIQPPVDQNPVNHHTNAPTETPNANARPNIQPTGTSGSVHKSATQVELPKPAAGQTLSVGGSTRRHNALPATRQHRQIVRLAKMPPHSPAHPPAPKKPHRPSYRFAAPERPGRKRVTLMILIGLLIFLIGVSAYLLRSDNGTSAPIAAKPEIDEKMTVTQLETNAPPILPENVPPKAQKHADPSIASKLKPLPVLEPSEPGETPVPSPPLSSPSLPAAEDSAVWQIETDDFILTVERPDPDAQTTAPLHPQSSEGISEKVHIVVPRDTLWHIARQYLGDPFRYPELAALSRIKNPDLIYPGDIVRIIIKRNNDN